jgi:hypothetical protein
MGSPSSLRSETKNYLDNIETGGATSYT